MAPLLMSFAWRVRAIPVSDARALRRRVLRPHQDPSASIYPDDDAPDTFHAGAFHGDELVGVASMYCEALEGFPAGTGWRIRGMATEPDRRGRGAGRALVEACAERARAARGTHLWCNARTSAAPFYAKCGFEIAGEPFPIEGIGPHYRMVRRVDGRGSEAHGG